MLGITLITSSQSLLSFDPSFRCNKLWFLSSSASFPNPHNPTFVLLSPSCTRPLSALERYTSAPPSPPQLCLSPPWWQSNIFLYGRCEQSGVPSIISASISKKLLLLPAPYPSSLRSPQRHTRGPGLMYFINWRRIEMRSSTSPRRSCRDRDGHRGATWKSGFSSQLFSLFIPHNVFVLVSHSAFPSNNEQPFKR